MPMPRRYPYPKIGDAHNNWIVVSDLLLKGKVLCQCVCGTNVWVKEGDMHSGKSRQCRSCADRQSRPGARRVHLPDVPDDLYNRLRLRAFNAIARCTDVSHHKYKDYGDRGIKVWTTDIKVFVEYLLTLDGHDNPALFLDRENNDGDYVPGNLRFVTPSVSRYNQRRCR